VSIIILLNIVLYQYVLVRPRTFNSIHFELTEFVLMNGYIFVRFHFQRWLFLSTILNRNKVYYLWISSAMLSFFNMGSFKIRLLTEHDLLMNWWRNILGDWIWYEMLSFNLIVRRDVPSGQVIWVRNRYFNANLRCLCKIIHAILTSGFLL
jgi:hypothetical protein